MLVLAVSKAQAQIRSDMAIWERRSTTTMIFTVLIAVAATVAAAERPVSASTMETRRGYFPPADSAGGWRTATNGAQMRKLARMELSRLEQTWAFTQRCTQNGGLLVVRNGWLVFEKYFGRASRNANPDMASTG